MSESKEDRLYFNDYKEIIKKLSIDIAKKEGYSKKENKAEWNELISRLNFELSEKKEKDMELSELLSKTISEYDKKKSNELKKDNIKSKLDKLNKIYKDHLMSEEIWAITFGDNLENIAGWAEDEDSARNALEELKELFKNSKDKHIDYEPVSDFSQYLFEYMMNK
jgi:hypothetical protein